jgi:hypothetical protein
MILHKTLWLKRELFRDSYLNIIKIYANILSLLLIFSDYWEFKELTEGHRVFY